MPTETSPRVVELVHLIERGEPPVREEAPQEPPAADAQREPAPGLGERLAACEERLGRAERAIAERDARIAGLEAALGELAAEVGRMEAGSQTAVEEACLKILRQEIEAVLAGR